MSSTSSRFEVVKGPAGSDIGRGASSGYINLISKLPGLDSINTASVAVGTANKTRLSADFNQKVGETAAVRLNVMAQDGGVDGRDEVKNSGIAIAPAFALGLGTPTRFYFYSQHVRQNNTPDGGIPTIGVDGFYSTNAFLRNGGKVDRENYYGSKNDYEKVDADMVTAKFEHDLGNGATVRNITRYGITKMDRVMTGINTLAATSADPSTWTVARLRQRTDQENEIFRQSDQPERRVRNRFRQALAGGGCRVDVRAPEDPEFRYGGRDHQWRFLCGDLQSGGQSLYTRIPRSLSVRPMRPVPMSTARRPLPPSTSSTRSSSPSAG